MPGSYKWTKNVGTDCVCWFSAINGFIRDRSDMV